MASPRRSAELRPYCPDGAALLTRIADGDESAFAALYDTTCGLIYGLLLRILGNSAAAERLLVAVYQEVWEQAATFDAAREKPLTWLITVAHSRAVARLRADRRGLPGGESHGLVGGAPKDRSETVEITSREQECARSAFAELSPAQQQIIELAYFSGLRQQEIAALLSLSLRAVQLRMCAAMRKLHDALGSRQLYPT